LSVLIKDPYTDRVIRELASRTGETMTDAVKIAAEERLARLSPKAGRIDMEKLEKLLSEIRAYRVDDPRTDDEIIGYDENGLPT
jgi:antitoxin VapB